MDCLVNIKTIIAVVQKSSELIKSCLLGENYGKYEEDNYTPDQRFSTQLESTQRDRTQCVISRLTKNMAHLLTDGKPFSLIWCDAFSDYC